MIEEDKEFNRIERESDMRTKAVSAALTDHAAFVSEYVKGFNAGVDCVLAEIERLEKTGPVSLEQLLKHLDPKRDEKTPQNPEKVPS
jgi:hypothetical protein